MHNYILLQLPAGGSAPLLDVIVNIHGGAFTFGSGSKWGPNYLMDQDLVFVTFNYRLGPLGKTIYLLS
jgi:carboxylesterase type B